MIYRNDNIKFNGENVIGTIKDIKEYFRYEIASKCMTGHDYNAEEFISTTRLILDLLEDLEDLVDESKTIEVYYNPMGSLDFKEYTESEDN